MAFLSLSFALFLALLVSPAHAFRRLPASYDFSPVEEDVESPDPCVTDPNGFFGTAGSAIEPITVEFDYEMEFTSSVSNEEYEQAVKDLDKAIADKILPLIFPGDCMNRRRLQTRRKLDVIAVSALPDDTKLEGVNCTVALTDSANNSCDVMSGGVRLFLSEANTHETLIASIRRLIEKAMNTDGDFNDGSVHPAIRQVTWVDLSPSRVEEQGGGAIASTTAASNGLSAGAITAIALSGVFIVGSVALWRRRANKNADGMEDDTQTLKTRDHTIEGATVGLETQEVSHTMDFSTIEGVETSHDVTSANEVI